MNQITIIAPNPNDEAVQHALKILQGNGSYTVTVEQPSPTALIALALGMLTGNAMPLAGTTTVDMDGDLEAGELEVDPDASIDGAADIIDTDITGGDGEEDIDISDTEFNFESLGEVNIDGELVEAFHNPKAKESTLYATNFQASGSAARCSYKLNESMFGFYPVPLGEGLVSNKSFCTLTTKHGRSSVALNIKESTKADKPFVMIGTDGLHLFSK